MENLINYFVLTGTLSSPPRWRTGGEVENPPVRMHAPVPPPPRRRQELSHPSQAGGWPALEVVMAFGRPRRRLGLLGRRGGQQGNARQARPDPMDELVSVRVEGDVLPAASLKAHQVLTNRVVPALRRVIGDRLLLPTTLVVRHAVDGHGASPDGLVPATVDGAGVITSVGLPAVSASEDNVHLAFVIGHELAHFHELNTRMRAGLAIPDRLTCWLWSEYYAQRVVCAAGLMDERLHTDFAEARPDTERPSTAGGNSSSWEYMLAFVWGQYDADSSCLDRYPEAQRRALKVLLTGIEHAPLHEAFRAFPYWTAPQRVLVEGFFRGLRATDPARQRRRRRRRRK